MNKATKSTQKITIPIDWDQKSSDLIRSPVIFERFQKYKSEFLINEEIPAFFIRYTEILDEDLIHTFKHDYDKFINNLQIALLDILEYDLEFKELKETKLKSLTAKDLHIIIYPENDELKSREIKTFSRNLTNFINKYVIIYGKIKSDTLNKGTVYKKIEFTCSNCGQTFERKNSERFEANMNPKKCSKCNHSFDPSDILGSDIREVGSFTIGDIDMRNYKYDLKCKIFKNMDYFIRKFEHLSFYENVKVIGIIRSDYSNIFDIKKSKMIYDSKYIEVLDVISERSHLIDKHILKVIQEKITKNPEYVQILIDAIHPYSFGIDIYTPAKLATVFGYVSGGSWRDGLRDTINSIVGGGHSSFKSKTGERFNEMILDADFNIVATRKMTVPGWIGTTVRNKETGQIEVKLGFVPRQSNGTIFLDEAQTIPFEIIDLFRCLNAGDVAGIQDSIDFHANAYCSVILSQNFKLLESGYYNNSENLFLNLGWKKENAISLLERFDLFVNISRPDKYVAKWKSKNEREFSKGKLYERMAELLELDDYNFPNHINNLIRIDEEKDIQYRKRVILEKIYYILRNFFWKAKEVYRNTNIDERYKDYIRAVYDEALDNAYERFNAEVNLNDRAKNTCYKILRALASFRLSYEVNYDDFAFFKLKCMPLILHFRDTELFNISKANANEIFIDSFLDLCKKKVIPIISMKEHILYMRDYIKRNYYNEYDWNNFEKIKQMINDNEQLNEKDLEIKERFEELEKEIDQITNNKTGLSGNNNYRCLIENLPNIQKLEEKGWLIKQYQNRTHFLLNTNIDIDNHKDADIFLSLKNVIDEILEEEDYDGELLPIEELLKSLVQIILIKDEKLRKIPENKLCNYIFILIQNRVFEYSFPDSYFY